jgi:glycosyltransferase involved in cell wall biosynthesis
MPGLNVLHLLWRGGGGGAERHVMDLAMGQKKAGLRVGVLYLFSDDGAGDLFNERGIPWWCAGIVHGLDPRGPFRVRRTIRRAKPGLVHDHVSTPWLRASLPRSRTRRIVATEHGHLLKERFTRERPRLWIERAGARATDLYLAPSRALASAVEKHLRYPAPRIRVVPHGIPPPRQTPTPELRERLRRNLGIGTESLLVLFVGRLDDNKGTIDLTEAFLAAAGRIESIHLVLAGRGEKAEAVQALASSSPHGKRIHLIGFRSDIETLMAGADILVLPSRHEGFGIVLLEAMAAGLPTIATRTGGIPEIVIADETGILVEPAVPQELADAVLRLAGDEEKRQSLGRSGQRRWEKEFSLDRMVERTLEAYRWLQDRPR